MMKMPTWKIIVGIIVIVGLGIIATNKTKAPTNTKATPTAATSLASSINYPCQTGHNAYDLLASSHKLETKDSEFGKQIMAIDDVKPIGNQFWAFYIDGQSSMVGAESYQCVATESISWKLESF